MEWLLVSALPSVTWVASWALVGCCGSSKLHTGWPPPPRDQSCAQTRSPPATPNALQPPGEAPALCVQQSSSCCRLNSSSVFKDTYSTLGAPSTPQCILQLV